MSFKDFLMKKESVFGNVTPGVYTHSGYDDPIKKAFRQGVGYVLKTNSFEEESKKIKNKKRKLKKWF